MTEFSKLYETHGKPVYRFLLRLTGNADQAEELLQETFYQALVHIGQFQGRSSIYTWLCRIAKNAWLKECRKNAVRADTPLQELQLPDPALTPEAALIRKDELHRIRQALLKLDEPYKEVFILHIYGGLKLKEIAEANEKSESWARVTYYRARAQIAKEVTE